MYLCIDIGATKTLIALVNNRRKILRSTRFLTPHNQKQFFTHLTTQISAHFSPQNLQAIVVAIPGLVKHNQPTRFANLPWHDFNFSAQLQPLSPAPIFFANDANLAGLAEAASLPGLSIYLTFSTGVGGSIIKNGNLDPRTHTFEPGHDQYKFKNKSLEWEDFASAKAISEHFGKYTSKIRKKSDWVEISCRIATGLRPIIIQFHPNQVIFGGPLGLALKKYRQPLEKQLSVALPSNLPLPQFLIAKYQHESVIYGCFIYAQRHLTTH